MRNILEYIEELMDQGMSEEDASRCAIGTQVITTQNIGVLKGMAKDYAKNKRKEVPIILSLPGGVKRVIVFRPDGRQVLKEERSETEC